MDAEAIKQLTDNAAQITNWSLYLTGGSIIALLGSIWIKPIGRNMRLSYLLYLVSWVLVGLAFKCGSDVITDSVDITIQPNSESQLLDLVFKIKADAASQLNYFNLALYAFGTWLIVYLLWWIFGDLKPKKAR